MTETFERPCFCRATAYAVSENECSRRRSRAHSREVMSRSDDGTDLHFDNVSCYWKMFRLVTWSGNRATSDLQKRGGTSEEVPLSEHSALAQRYPEIAQRARFGLRFNAFGDESGAAL
jgi:hypothetical protein